MSFLLSMLEFWLYHPALLYGISFFLGLNTHFSKSLLLLIPCCTLWIPYLIAFFMGYRNVINHFILSFLTFLTASLIAPIHYSLPQLPKEGLTGKGYVKILSITLQHTVFGERWLYRCELQKFIPENSEIPIFYSIPCLISLPVAFVQNKQRPLANQDYWVEGKLSQTKAGSYRFNIRSKSNWKAVQGSYRFAEVRYKWKKKMNEWIESKHAHVQSASFLAGLATGEFDDLWMREQFARFGLQHLLAISGFHFAIIAGFLSFILSFFLSHNIRMATLLVLLTSYCFFLGPQASILRAWLMCSIALLGGLIKQQSTALNSLGLALLLILAYNPLMSQELGFQLSFATTFAILLLYQPAIALCEEVLPKRKLSQVLQMNGWQQHGYCLLTFLRQGFALTLAVNAIAFPLTLYYFQQFPIMSLLYNLFYPFLATGSLCMLLLGVIFSFIPFLGQMIHHFNDAYTFFLLQLTYQIPKEIDIYLSVENVHPILLIIYLCSIIVVGIISKQRSQNQSQEELFKMI